MAMDGGERLPSVKVLSITLGVLLLSGVCTLASAIPPEIEDVSSDEEREILGLLTSLMDVPSVSGLDEHQADRYKVIEIAKDFLQGSKWKCSVFQPNSTHPSLYITPPDRKGKAVVPSVLLVGHLDVVQDSDGSPFKLIDKRDKNDKLYGRGVADMKGLVAAMLVAIKELDPTDYILGALITTDEERGGAMGAGSFWTANVTRDYALPRPCTSVGDDNCTRVAIVPDGAYQFHVRTEEKGMLWLDLTTSTMNASGPGNVCVGGEENDQSIASHCQRVKAEGRSAMFLATSIEAGKSRNQVPDTAVVKGVLCSGKENIAAMSAVLQNASSVGNAEVQVTHTDDTMAQITIVNHGRSCHSSRPWEGHNALADAARNVFSILASFPASPSNAVVASLFDMSKLVELQYSGVHVFNNTKEAGYHTTISPTTISSSRGGCDVQMHVDIRYNDVWVQDQSNPVLSSALDDLINRALSEANKTRVSQREVGHIMYSPDAMRNDGVNYINIAREAIQETIGRKPMKDKGHGASDGRFLSALGIPVLMFCPDGGNTHGQDEYVRWTKEGVLDFFRVVKALSRHWSSIRRWRFPKSSLLTPLVLSVLWLACILFVVIGAASAIWYSQKKTSLVDMSGRPHSASHDSTGETTSLIQKESVRDEQVEGEGGGRVHNDSL